MQRQRYFGAVLGLMMIIALSGCGDTAAPSPTPTPSPTPPQPTATAALTGALVIGPITWADSLDPLIQAPVATVAVFSATSTTLYATVPLQNVPAGTVFTATWTYNDTALDAMTTTIVAAAQRAAWQVTFSLTSTDGSAWPTGTYQVVISAPGAANQMATIQVANG